jgi:hypothetical protein
MSMHDEPFEGAGQTLKLNAEGIDADEIHVEDYWDRVAGKSWMFCDGNPAALKFAVRSAMSGLPTDDEVVYGKVAGLGHIVHVSELGGAL